MKHFIALFFCNSFVLLCSLLLTTVQPLNAQNWSRQDLQRERIEKQQEGKKYGYGAIAFFAGCFAIGIWLRQRQLSRTNQYGVEVFKQGEYFQKSIFEGLANLIAVILFAGGLISLITAAIKCN